MNRGNIDGNTSGENGWAAFSSLFRDKLNQRMATLPLKRISVEGYKGMKSYTSFNMRPLVLLTGQNSSGKSSLLEVLQIIGRNESLDGLSLHELAAKLGGFSRVINRDCQEKRFSVSYDKFNDILKKEVSVSCSFEVEEENAQRCRLVILTIETEEDVLIELNVTDLERLTGYINYPLLWEAFGNAFADCVKVRSSKGSTYKEDDGTTVSLKYRHYQSFFKDKVQHYSTNDFEAFPIYYLESPLYGQEKDLVEEFPFYNNDVDVERFSDLERAVFKSFYIDTYHDEVRPILSTLTDVVFNPFEFLISDEVEDLSDDSAENPYWNLLRSGRSNRKFKTVDLTRHRTYFKYRGMSEADLDILFEGIDFSSKPKVTFSQALADNDLSAEGVRVLKQVQREQSLRNNFNKFIVAATKDAITNAIPPHVLVPAVRNGMQLAMMNFGDTFQYGSFLQQSAAQFINLSDTKKSFLGVHLQIIVQKFGFGSDVRAFSDENGLLHIYIKKNGVEYPISDEGYGISQLFSIVLGVCVQALKNVDDSVIHEFMMGLFNPDFGELLVCIEEPEANLHPNYQSLLADMFVYLSREFGVQFILETHSEYLIRRLRYLTALWYRDPNSADAVPKEFWTAYYFNRADLVTPEQPKVFEINVVDEEGNLNRSFGSGFLDTATQSELDYLDLFKTAEN